MLKVLSKKEREIWLIDDDEGFHYSFKRRLSNYGNIRVESFITPTESRDMIANVNGKCPDYITVDVDLLGIRGNMLGVRLLEDFRKKKPDVPAVLTTEERKIKMAGISLSDFARRWNVYFYDKDTLLRNLPKILEEDFSIQDWTEEADRCFKRKNYHEALSKYRQASLKKPKSAYLHRKIGSIEILFEHYDSAIMHLHESLKIDSKNFSAWRNIGYAFMKVERHKEAKNSFKKCVQINKKDGNSWNNLGLVYGILGEQEKAKEAYKVALEQQPDNITAMENLGIAYLKLKNYGQSRKIFEKMLKLRPNSEKIWLQLGYINLSLRKYSEAKKCFLEAIKLNSSNIHSLVLCGVLSFILGDLEDSERCLKKATALRPADLGVLLGLCLISIEKGNLHDFHRYVEYLRRNYGRKEEI